MLDRAYASGTIHDWDFHRGLGAAGGSACRGPAPTAARNGRPMEAALFYEEANRALAPLYGMNTTMVAARAVLTLSNTSPCLQKPTQTPLLRIAMEADKTSD